MRSLIALISLALFGMPLNAMSELGGHTLLVQGMSSPHSPKAHPEERLVAALDRFAEGQTIAALDELETLVQEQPNFRLAQLIYGDLLKTRAGDTDALKLTSRNRRLKALIQEARVRWEQRRMGPAPDAVPNVLLRMAIWEERVVLVDLKASRLYLLWSVAGRPRVIEDYYIGIGKAGIGKRREGDRRTPVGVYRITEYLNQNRLKDMYDEDAALYGIGALPVSYPNLHDRLLGRTGSGIWLHGVPDDTYVRPPRSSRGCVTMANDDFVNLLKQVAPGYTLVIFSDSVQWLAVEEAKAREKEILAAMRQWQIDWRDAHSDTFIDHYSDDFSNEKVDFPTFLELQHRTRAERGKSRVEIDNLSVMEYPGEDDTMLVTFRQTTVTGNIRGHIRKQQYWRKEVDGRWRIIREGVDDDA